MKCRRIGPSSRSCGSPLHADPGALPQAQGPAVYRPATLPGLRIAPRAHNVVVSQPPEVPPPQQPLPYPYQHQYQQQYPPLPPYNLYAILSLIISLVVFPPVGIYLGYKAKEEIARTGERGIELAQVGIIAGWVLTSLYALLIIVWCGFVLTMVGTAGFSGSG